MGAPLPKPVFVSTDAAEAEAELKGYYEGLIAPRKLRPAQVEMLHVKFGAYVLNLARIGIQLAAEQLLLAYARYPIIDYLGQYVGVERKEAEPARTTIRFTLTEAQETDLLIPAGARVRSFDGKMVFATEEDATVPAGEEAADVTAAAKTAGEAGNDYEAGDVADLLDLNPAIASAVNVTVSAGGAGREDDERV
ncbi:MAG: baseplate J/gp47 family protein, partial [Candidatus Methylomirabilis sp.]|nr:baseplate J/gp47 family protein [Deltaproteobacteria bacterium]